MAQALMAHLPARPPTSKSASFFLPPLSAATSQRGLLPRPAQVSFAFAALRYFATKECRLVLRFAFASNQSFGFGLMTVTGHPSPECRSSCYRSIRVWPSYLQAFFILFS